MIEREFHKIWICLSGLACNSLEAILKLETHCHYVESMPVGCTLGLPHSLEFSSIKVQRLVTHINIKGQSWGFTSCSTARIILGQVLSIDT